MKTVISLCLIALFAVSKGRNIINEDISETTDRTTISDLTGKTEGTVDFQGTTRQPIKIVEPEIINPIIPDVSTRQPDQTVEPEPTTTSTSDLTVNPEIEKRINPGETTGQPGKIVEPDTINPITPVVSTGQPDQTAEPEPISTSYPTVVTDQTDNIVVPEPKPTESIKLVITGCPPRSCVHENFIPTACRKANYFWYNRRRCRACDSNTCRGEFLRLTGHLLNKAILIGRERD